MERGMGLMPCIVFLFEPVQVHVVRFPALPGDAEISRPGTAAAVLASTREQAGPLLDAQYHLPLIVVVADATTTLLRVTHSMWPNLVNMKLAFVILIIAAVAGCSSSTSSSVPVPPSSSSSLSASSSSTPTATISPSSSPASGPAPAPAPGSRCTASLWQHIYHTARLHVISPCRTLAGTVREVIREADGDVHVWIVPDPAYVTLARGGIHGWMTAEIICHGSVIQADAVAACAGYSSPLTVPVTGDHVKVTGSYVLDTDHGWTEIHPVSKISITGRAAAIPVPPATRTRSYSPPPTHAAAACYPKTNSGNCYEPGEFCRKSDHGASGLAGDGKRITCVLSGSRWRWES